MGCELSAVCTATLLRARAPRGTDTAASWSRWDRGSFARSSKITMVTLSVTEAERFGTAEGGTYAVFMTAIIPRFGHSLEGPVHMQMDSTSAEAALSCEGSFARNKHILYKKGFVKELKETGVIDTTHTPGAFLVADMLTKPLALGPLERHIKKLQSVYL